MLMFAALLNQILLNNKTNLLQLMFCFFYRYMVKWIIFNNYIFFIYPAIKQIPLIFPLNVQFIAFLTNVSIQRSVRFVFWNSFSLNVSTFSSPLDSSNTYVHSLLVLTLDHNLLQKWFHILKFSNDQWLWI